MFDAWRQAVPLDLYGMDAEAAGGTGELPYAGLFAALARYRFFAHPVRYTSLALAICEAMTIGLPVIGLATTELPKIIAESGGGYVDNDIARLIGHSRELIRDHGHAAELSRKARELIQKIVAKELPLAAPSPADKLPLGDREGPYRRMLLILS